MPPTVPDAQGRSELRDPVPQSPFDHGLDTERSEYHGDHFWVMQEGKRFATPLFLVLIVIELTDVIFAVDSVPAILACRQASHR